MPASATPPPKDGHGTVFFAEGYTKHDVAESPFETSESLFSITFFVLHSSYFAIATLPQDGESLGLPRHHPFEYRRDWKNAKLVDYSPLVTSAKLPV